MVLPPAWYFFPSETHFYSVVACPSSSCTDPSHPSTAGSYPPAYLSSAASPSQAQTENKQVYSQFGQLLVIFFKIPIWSFFFFFFWRSLNKTFKNKSDLIISWQLS